MWVSTLDQDEQRQLEDQALDRMVTYKDAERPRLAATRVLKSASRAVNLRRDEGSHGRTRSVRRALEVVPDVLE